MFDHQKVKLVGITTPQIESCETSEQFISYCARVSNPTNQDNFKTAGKLLKYCLDNNHYSIFEMVNVCFEIETTRDIARQILRHRSFSFQEFSQRYADPNQLGMVIREARLQDSKNRQNSVETDDESLQHNWKTLQEEIQAKVFSAYNWAIKNGVAKEQARAILPEGMTMSRMYMNGTLRSWIHYINVRDGNGTQKEHIDIAQKIKKILYQEFKSLNEMNE